VIWNYKSGEKMQLDDFDWHSDQITNSTPVTKTYRNTQNVESPKQWVKWHRNGCVEMTAHNVTLNGC